jgi:Leucine-rich repeat (LRR) protein
MPKSPNDSADTNPPKRRRRWFAYSLRTLIVLVTIIALWLGWWVHSAREQQKAIAAIRAAGGGTSYDFQAGDHRCQRGQWGILLFPPSIVDKFGEDYFQNVVGALFSFNQRPLPSLTDETMRWVGELSQLEALDAGFLPTKLTDSGVSHLAGLRQLRRISLVSESLTDESLRVLGSLQRLEELDLSLGWHQIRPPRKITDTGMHHLRSLSDLHCLRIGNTAIADAGISSISKMTKLCVLELPGSQVTGRGFALLPTMPSVEHLDLWGAPLDDTGLAHLDCFPHLKGLRISHTQVTDAGLRHLLELKELETLELDGTHITDAIWQTISQMPSLTQLSLSGTKVAGIGMQLGRQLGYLDLSDTDITDQAIVSIDTSRLRVLRLGGTKVTPDFVEKLRSARPKGGSSFPGQEAGVYY